MNALLENKADFEKLFKDNYPVLCRIARGYIKNEFIVEEIVCEAFLKLWNNRSEIKITHSLNHYLTRAVINTAIDYYRKEKKRLEKTISIEENIIVCTTLADLGEDPLAYLISSEQQQALTTAIELLPERYKTTFKLCRLEQLSYDEVARLMGISKNTVKSNLRDALEILRSSLKNKMNYLYFIPLFLTDLMAWID